VYRAIDEYGQVIDVFVSPRRDAPAAKQFFTQAIKANGCAPAEVVTDKASTYPGVLDELLPGTFHNTVKHANNAIENDHGRLKARLRPMRGLKQDRSALIIIAGHALIQNLRRGHYELGIDASALLRLEAAFTELASTI
jgi:transposase, IS6 family